MRVAPVWDCVDEVAGLGLAGEMALVASFVLKARFSQVKIKVLLHNLNGNLASF